MYRFVFPLIPCWVLCVALPVSGDVEDCLWGGSNESTSYTSSYVPGMGNVTLAQYSPAPMNLGTPQPVLPVQATPQTQPVQVPQANIPTITIPAGPVGSVGQPATVPNTAQQASPGTEIVYILPSSQSSKAEVYLDGVTAVPANETKIVPANTPGAFPAMLQTVIVRRPKVEYHWRYAPIERTVEKTVQVVDPRTGRTVQTYGQEETQRTILPWLHRQEVISYETVEAKIAVPISVTPSVSSATSTMIQGGNFSYPVQ